MSYERAILIRNQGCVRVRVDRDDIRMEIEHGANGGIVFRLTPEQATILMEALDTALCYYGERKVEQGRNGQTQSTEDGD